jgi:ABC-2 type transport system permease protein
MKINRRRVIGMFRKEVLEYRRTRSILVTLAVIPLVFLVQPLVTVFTFSSSSSHTLRHAHELLYLLTIPALMPALLAAYAVVGERQQGTLEPLLTTPLRREELLLGKALAVFVPSVAIAYAVYALVLILIVLFAHAGVASALIHGPEVVAQVIFTPLIAFWSIWNAMAISAVSSDIRVAQQLNTLASLPSIAIVILITANVIHPSLKLALAFGVGLVVLSRLGWRISSALFDRERLLTGRKP